MIDRHSQGKTTSPLAVKPMGMQLPWDWLFALASSARVSDSDIAESTTTKAANFIGLTTATRCQCRPFIDNKSGPSNYVSPKAFVGKTKSRIIFALHGTRLTRIRIGRLKKRRAQMARRKLRGQTGVRLVSTHRIEADLSRSCIDCNVRASVGEPRATKRAARTPAPPASRASRPPGNASLSCRKATRSDRASRDIW
jgi:hypothetical protein